MYEQEKVEAPPSASAPDASESVSATTAAWRDQALAGLEEALRRGKISQAEFDQAKRDLESVD